MVKKGVNWALRQIGKRNALLNRAALAAAVRFIAWIHAPPAGLPPTPGASWKARPCKKAKARTRQNAEAIKGEE